MRTISTAVAVVAVGLLCSAPAFASHSTTKCGNSVCLEVTNAAQGSDYVVEATVYLQQDVLWRDYYSILVRGTVRYSQWNNGAFSHPFGYNVDTGSCIQGRIDDPIIAGGYPVSPCWVAP